MNQTAQAITIDPASPAYWRHACTETDKNKRLSYDYNLPHVGRYRIKWEGRWTPIAYWWENGDWDYVINKDDSFPGGRQTALEMWTWAVQNPITEEVYNFVIEGGQWPDLDPVVAEQTEAPRERIGGNRPPADKFTDVKTQIENAVAQAVREYSNINDDATSNLAAGVRARLNELKNLADKQRKEDIGDHYDLYMKAHTKWKPLVDAALAAARAIGDAMSRWETKRARMIEEQQRQARQAEEAQARAADAAIAQGVPPSALPAPEPPPVAPEQRSQVKGGYGKAASVKVVKAIKEVDWPKMWARYGEREEVRAAINKLIRRDLDAGIIIDGVTTEDERKVR